MLYLENENHLQLTMGRKFLVTVTVVDEDDEAHTWESGEIVKLGVKRGPKDKAPLFTINGNKNSGGEAVFTFSAASTKDLDPGTYWYEVMMTDGSGDPWNIIPLSQLDILPNGV